LRSLSLFRPFTKIPIKAKMRPDYRQKMSRAIGQQQLTGGKPVKHQPRKDYRHQLTLRQIFIEQYNPVPEIQVRFTGMSLAQRSAPHVVYSAFAGVHDAVAHVSQAPAKINFLHVGEESIV
jgi:hypothetical protein